MSEVDFWSSPEGIQTRIAMLAEYVQFRTINGAVQVYALALGVQELEWVSAIDKDTCDYCDSQSGRHYRIGQFMPEIPVHPGCRCSYDIVS